ncbi:MAG: hypothetical protein M0P57_07575 [Syntrophales bacterium]|jgi:hypothetical protein|nr:hypothetical protein [Syntrophales bacterium]MDY0043196.1 hypothetical protein [Syntrophales bacterium]
MKKNKLAIYLILSIFFLAMSNQSITAAESITGEVNDDFQIISETGEAYNVYSSEAGNEVVEHVGEKITVTGEVEIIEGEKWINIISYTLLEDRSDKDTQ